MTIGWGDGLLLDLASYARPGPGRRNRLTLEQIGQVSRTVRRVPEVMVKVLSRGGQDLKAVCRHLDYLRHRQDGEREIDTDDGRRLSGEGIAKALLEDWDLDLEEWRPRSDLSTRDGGSKKLVHKVLFSMPAGTSPAKVLAAVKNLARDEFALKHRYAMVLHTDEPHPHVHLVLKAVSEQGERLHIRKATLRHWRREFARHLRALGVAANATERAVRGENRKPKKDGIFRASLRGDSTHMRLRSSVVAEQIAAGKFQVEAGKETMARTRGSVRSSWQEIADRLAKDGHPALAAEVQTFTNHIPPPMTERDLLAAEMLRRTREPTHRGQPVR